MNAEAVKHLKDLKKLKDVDYSFYKYLEESGKDLLDPVDFVDGFDSKDESEYASEDELENEVNLPRLTREKLSDIKKDLVSTRSIESLTFLLTCFKSVASINTLDDEKVPTRKSLEKSKKIEKESNNFLKRSSKKERVSDLHIEEPELMFEVIQFTLDNVPLLFWFHSSNGKPEDELCANILPADLPKWKKIEKMCSSFWQDLGNLILYNCLNSNPTLELMEYIFDRISNPRFIMWLLPNRMSTIRFTTLLSRIWTMNKYLALKKGSFNVLKTINSSFEKLSSIKDENNYNESFEFKFTDKNELLSNPVKRHEDFLLLLHRTIGISAMRGISWKNYTSSMQVIDEYVTLLTESDHKKVYRMAYNVIRKLGSLLRLLFIRLSRKNETIKQKDSKKQEKDSSLEEICSNIYSWKFLTFVRIWTKTIAAIPYLTPLQYPITVIMTSVIKLKLNSIAFLPFTLQCFKILIEMMSKMRTLIPITEMLFETHNTIERGVKESYVKRKQCNLKLTNIINTTSKVLVPEFEIKIGNQLLKSTQVFDSIQEYWTHIIVLHISGLRSLYFYPEFLIGIVPTLKRLQKQNSRHWNDQVSLKTREILKLAQKHSECISVERCSIETNTKYINFLLESLNSEKTNTNKSNKKSYNTLSYIDPNFKYNSQIRSVETCNSLTQFLNDEVNKRAEYLNSRIKLSSLKSSNQSNIKSDIYIYDQTGQQDDLEFTSLLHQLGKIGKTIDDLKNIGPRQLKKLKKSIKNEITNKNLNETTSNTSHNNIHSHVNLATNISKNKSFFNFINSDNEEFPKSPTTNTHGTNSRVNSTKIKVLKNKRKKADENTNIISKEARKIRPENLKKLKINPKDSIQEWDLTLSDSDNN
ncbi:hypothetical protein FG386_002239 [Cryptosporidium ryanae]|uniref:uncharacterized protein n=1 Tax=Cryptosporidium ryanae TaxID=515981 RepID=UPI00351A41F5|nr:hypothetical protein FG386_002239 [Cryptosporidium ryanae]